MTFLYFSLGNPSLVAVRQGVGWVGPFVCCCVTVLRQCCDNLEVLSVLEYITAASWHDFGVCREVHHHQPPNFKRSQNRQKFLRTAVRRIFPASPVRMCGRGVVPSAEQRNCLLKVRCISPGILLADQETLGMTEESERLFFSSVRVLSRVKV